MFSIREYSSEEPFDLAKFMQFDIDVYDVLNCQLLERVKSLPVYKYYNISEGYRDVDLISSEIYGTPFYAFYIQHFNDLYEDTFSEGTILKLFSLTDLNNLFHDLSMLGGE